MKPSFTARTARTALQILAPTLLLITSTAEADLLDSVKEAGRSIGEATRNVTREIGHTSRDVTREIGHTSRDVTREIGHATREALTGDSTKNGQKDKDAKDTANDGDALKDKKD